MLRWSYEWAGQRPCFLESYKRMEGKNDFSYLWYVRTNFVAISKRFNETFQAMQLYICTMNQSSWFMDQHYGLGPISPTTPRGRRRQHAKLQRLSLYQQSNDLFECDFADV